MKQTSEIVPEFKAKLRKTGTSYAITIPLFIKELWDIGDNEEIIVRIYDKATMRKALIEHATGVFNIRHSILKKRGVAL